MQRAIISTSNSKPDSSLSSSARMSCRPMSRYPDWLSGTPCPSAADKVQPPSVFDRRRTGGISPKSRRPMTSSVASARERGEEARDLGRVVLAVGVERHDGRGARREGVPEAAPQRRALAGVGDLAQDGRPGRLGDGRGVVREPSSTTTTGRCASVAVDDRRRCAVPPRTPG